MVKFTTVDTTRVIIVAVVVACSLTDDAISSLDKPNQTTAAEVAKTPTEVLPSKPTASAAVQSTEVQEESSHTTGASHQQASAAGAVDHVTLPPNLTETHGQHDA